MSNNKSSFDELIEQALQNAIDDRNRAVDAFEKTKSVYDIDLNGEDGNSSNLQGLMLIGQNVSKLLECSMKSNEQIIKLAQLRKEKTNKSSDEKKPFDVEQLRQLEEEQEKVH